MRAWIGGIAAVVLLAWFWLLASLPFLDTDVKRPTGAGQFVPAKHTPAARVMFGRPGRIASSESVLFEGLSIAGEFPGSALAQIRPPRGGVGLVWWRQTFSPIAHDRVPEPETTLRWVDAKEGGMGLALRTGRDPVAFQPALLELPTTPKAGDRWSSQGELRDREGAAPYRNESSAATPGDRREAERGCLEVTSVTTARGQERRDVATWCPDAGIVRGTPTHGTPVEPLLVPWPAPQPPRTPTRPKPVEGRVVLGRTITQDPVFGPDDVSVADLRLTPVLTTSGLSVWPANTTGALVAVGQEGERAVVRSWLAPGGQAVRLSVLGDVVLVTTTERRLVAYHTDGRRLWSALLDDIATGGAVPRGEDQVVVATLTGQVQARRISDGSMVWEQTVKGGTSVAPEVIGGRILVTGKDGAITALGLDGSRLWRNDEPGVEPIGFYGDDLNLYALDGPGSLVAFDAATGKPVRHEIRGYGDNHERVVLGQSAAAVVGERGVRLDDRAQGRELGMVAGATDAVPDGDGWWLVTPTEVLRTNRAGVVDQRLPLGATFDSPTIHLRPGQVWVLGGNNQEVAWIS